jgi:Na+-translocating ferredoxin:NAD+ oxidoreductase RnfD subunit
MAVYLTALLIYGAFAFAGPMSLLKGAAIVFLYATFDLVWTYLRDKVWYFPLSSFISGFVLSIVSKPDLPIFFIVLLPLLAVCSKQFLHFGKTRHIFNPAAFAMAVTSFFVPVISWWATGWDIVPLVIFSLTGIFILWKQERWHVAIPFLALYSILLFIFLLISGVTSGNIPGILTAQLVNGTLLFFSTVMLIEPMTSAFATQRERIFYGLSVAVFSVGVAAFLRLTNIQNQDPLILGLLIGNLTASLLFLPKRKKDIMQANS